MFHLRRASGGGSILVAGGGQLSDEDTAVKLMSEARLEAIWTSASHNSTHVRQLCAHYADGCGRLAVSCPPGSPGPAGGALSSARVHFSRRTCSLESALVRRTGSENNQMKSLFASGSRKHARNCISLFFHCCTNPFQRNKSFSVPAGPRPPIDNRPNSYL